MFLKTIQIGDIIYYPRPNQTSPLVRVLKKSGSKLYTLAERDMIIPSLFRVKGQLLESGPVSSFDILKTKRIYLGLSRLSLMLMGPMSEKIVRALCIPSCELISYYYHSRFKSSPLYDISWKFYSGYLMVRYQKSKVEAKTLGKKYLDILISNQKNLSRGIMVPEKSELFPILAFFDTKKMLKDPLSFADDEVVRETYMRFFNIDPYRVHSSKVDQSIYPLAPDLISPGRPAGRVLIEKDKVDILNRVV